MTTSSTPLFLMSSSPFVPDPGSYVPINPELRCGEEWIADDHGECSHDRDDDDSFHPGPIDFRVVLPGFSDERRLVFNCRDRSSGVLLPDEAKAAVEDGPDGRMDPFFFERGFYLEAKTGFQVWPGSRLLLEAFTCMTHLDDHASFRKAKSWQEKLAGKNLNILEVGAGMGIVGTCLAFAGGNALVTDLPVLAEHGIRPNIERNGAAHRRLRTTSESEEPGEPPAFLGVRDDSSNDFPPTPIGRGWARAGVLDWFRPVSEQLSRDASSAVDVVVACDCIFLEKLVDPLLSAVSAPGCWQ